MKLRNLPHLCISDNTHTVKDRPTFCQTGMYHIYGISIAIGISISIGLVIPALLEALYPCIHVICHPDNWNHGTRINITTREDCIFRC